MIANLHIIAVFTQKSMSLLVLGYYNLNDDGS